MHTEHVHMLMGMLTIVMGAALWWKDRYPHSWARFVWPTSVLLVGFFMFIPVERATRTYMQVGIWDTMLSAFPANAAEWRVAVPTWFELLRKPHVLQHKITGVVGLVAGTVEFARARGGAIGWGRWVVPVSLLVVAVMLGVHGGTAEHLPHPVETMHHHIFGACFAGAGAALTAIEAGWLRYAAWRSVPPLFLLTGGVDMALFYRLH